MGESENAIEGNPAHQLGTIREIRAETENAHVQTPSNGQDTAEEAGETSEEETDESEQSPQPAVPEPEEPSGENDLEEIANGRNRLVKG